MNEQIYRLKALRYWMWADYRMIDPDIKFDWNWILSRADI